MTAASTTPRGSQCLCRGCGKLFRSERPFERHFTGDYDLNTRRCLTATELQAKGYVQNARGVWQFAPRPFDPALRVPKAEKRPGGETAQARG